MDVTELFSFIKDFGFPMVLSWFLLVRMENKLAGLTVVIGELSCNIASLRGVIEENLQPKTAANFFASWE